MIYLYSVINIHFKHISMRVFIILLLVSVLVTGCKDTINSPEIENEITIDDVHVLYIESDIVRVSVFDDYILPDSIGESGYYWSLTISDFEYYRSLEVDRGSYIYEDYSKWYVEIPCEEAFDESIELKIWTDTDTLRTAKKQASGMIDFLNRTC